MSFTQGMFSFFLYREIFFVCYLYFNYILVKCNAPFIITIILFLISVSCLYFTADCFLIFFSFLFVCVFVLLLLGSSFFLFSLVDNVFVFFKQFFPQLYVHLSTVCGLACSLLLCQLLKYFPLY